MPIFRALCFAFVLVCIAADNPADIVVPEASPHPVPKSEVTYDDRAPAVFYTLLHSSNDDAPSEFVKRVDANVKRGITKAAIPEVTILSLVEKYGFSKQEIGDQLSTSKLASKSSPDLFEKYVFVFLPRFLELASAVGVNPRGLQIPLKHAAKLNQQRQANDAAFLSSFLKDDVQYPPEDQFKKSLHKADANHDGKLSFMEALDGSFGDGDHHGRQVTQLVDEDANVGVSSSTECKKAFQICVEEASFKRMCRNFIDRQGGAWTQHLDDMITHARTWLFLKATAQFSGGELGDKKTYAVGSVSSVTGVVFTGGTEFGMAWNGALEKIACFKGWAVGLSSPDLAAGESASFTIMTREGDGGAESWDDFPGTDDVKCGGVGYEAFGVEACHIQPHQFCSKEASLWMAKDRPSWCQITFLGHLNACKPPSCRPPTTGLTIGLSFSVTAKSMNPIPLSGSNVIATCETSDEKTITGATKMSPQAVRAVKAMREDTKNIERVYKQRVRNIEQRSRNVASGVKTGAEGVAGGAKTGAEAVAGALHDVFHNPHRHSPHNPHRPHFHIPHVFRV